MIKKFLPRFVIAVFKLKCCTMCIGSYTFCPRGMYIGLHCMYLIVFSSCALWCVFFCLAEQSVLCLLFVCLAEYSFVCSVCFTCCASFSMKCLNLYYRYSCVFTLPVLLFVFIIV